MKITVNNLKFKYFNSEKKIKVDSFEINENEFVLITGPSGSGKSTFLGILKGLIPKFIRGSLTGEINFSEDITNEDVVYVFQNPYSQLIAPFVNEELVFTMENYKFSKDKISNNVDRVTHEFNLKNILQNETYKLSGGECQRVILASALASNPKILMFDEPTAFMDPKGREMFYNELAKLKKHYTVIIIDHKLDEVLHLADKVLHFDNVGVGKLKDSKNIQTEEFLHSNGKINFLNSYNEKLKLELKNVKFSYEKNKTLLENINLEAKNSDVIALIGNNGTGKSTLIKLLLGIEKPEFGSVNFQENNKKIKKIENITGVMFQNPESNFFFDTVKEELENSFAIGDGERGKDLFLNLVKYFDLYDYLEKSPYMLSEGQKRRLSILINILQNKNLLIYDEPTFGQDFINIKKLESIILEIKKMKKIQLIVTHDLDFAKNIATKIVKLNNNVLEDILL